METWLKWPLRDTPPVADFLELPFEATASARVHPLQYNAVTKRSGRDFIHQRLLLYLLTTACSGVEVGEVVPNEPGN
jgi:hypothetical protein